MQPEALDEARDWLTMAERDLGAGSKVLLGKDPFPGDAAFHAQQAAEKALKAFLAAHNHPFPKTHDLDRLLGWCQDIETEFGRFSNSMGALTAYAVEPRYPGGPPEPDQSVARDALRLAGEVVGFVREQLFSN